MAGVGARRTADWLRRWLKSPELMATSDPDAQRLLREYLVVMPEPDLAAPEIESLAGFLAGLR